MRGGISELVVSLVEVEGVMKGGLLWFDDDPQRAIEEKVRQAAKRYREKFRRAANACYINPVSLQGDGRSKDGFRCGLVKMIVTPKVLPQHFWLGVADPSPEEEAVTTHP